MSSESGAILEFPVKLSASISGEVDALIAKLQEAKELVGEVSETTTAEGVVEEGEEKEKAAVTKITELLEGVDDQGIRNLKSFMTNTDLFTEASIVKVLSRAGPYGAVIVAIIALLMSTPELVKQVVKVMGMKGGPMNLDFRYDQEQQFDQLFSRQLQFTRAFALDPVITVNTKGFVVIDPTFEGNSLIMGNLARSARIGINLSSYGYIHGI